MRDPDAALRERAAGIALAAFDVDGTLTDGGLYFGPDGERLKRFSVHDGFGLALLREAGLRLAIVTGRRSDIVAVRAAELRIDDVIQGCADKATALRDLAARHGLSPAACAFMGDDWPDLPAMRAAGLAATVAGAPAAVRLHAHWVSTRPAGNGAVREFAEWLLEARGALGPLLARRLDGHPEASGVHAPGAPPGQAR